MCAGVKHICICEMMSEYYRTCFEFVMLTYRLKICVHVYVHVYIQVRFARNTFLLKFVPFVSAVSFYAVLNSCSFRHLLCFALLFPLRFTSNGVVLTTHLLRSSLERSMIVQQEMTLAALFSLKVNARQWSVSWYLCSGLRACYVLLALLTLLKTQTLTLAYEYSYNLLS